MTIFSGHLFLTGGTGVVGSEICKLCLEQGNFRLSLLVRNSKSRAKNSVDLLIKYLGDLYNQNRHRITLLEGDAGSERFGLSESDYLSLSATVTHIIGCAGDVRLNLPLSEARKSAVNGVRQLINLAKNSPKLTKLEYVSTVGVAGKDLTTVTEKVLGPERTFRNSYEQAKAEAEDLLIRQGEALPWTIHRPSMVVGDSKTGASIRPQVFYYLSRFISGTETFGFCPPLGNHTLDIIPVDFVATAIWRSAINKSNYQEFMHLCSGPDLALGLTVLQGRVRELQKQKGEIPVKLRVLPTWAFSGLTKLGSRLAPSSLSGKLKNLRYFLAYLETPQVFKNDNFTRFLRENKLELPGPLDYLDKVLSH